MKDNIWAIIPNRIEKKHQAWLLKKCLESLFDLEPKMAGKVIVCDDHSPLQEDLSNVLASFPVKLMRHKTRVNYSQMINSGIKAAKMRSACGLITINNDIEHKTPFLEKLENICLADEKISVIGPLLFYPDGRTQHGGINVTEESEGPWCEDPFRGKTGLWGKPRFCHHVTGAWQFIKLNSLPIEYEKKFPITFQDVDFTLRLWEYGRRTFYTDKIYHIHHEGATRGQVVTKKEIESSKIFKEIKYNFTFINKKIEDANYHIVSS